MSVRLPARRKKQILAALDVPANKQPSNEALLFIVCAAQGMSAALAYRIARPHVTADSSRTCGARWIRLHAQHVRTLRENKDLRVALGSDLIQEQIMLDPDLMPSDRLAAARAFDQKLARLQPDTQVNVLNVIEQSRERDAPARPQLPGLE